MMKWKKNLTKSEKLEKKQNRNKAIYTIYKIDKDGNEELLLTQIIDKSIGLRLNT